MPSRAGAGRLIQAAGLVGLLGALVYGLQTDDISTELLAGTAAVALILIGRSMQGGGTPS